MFKKNTIQLPEAPYYTQEEFEIEVSETIKNKSCHESPQVCLFDFNKDTLNVLDKHRFNYTNTRLHARVNFPQIQSKYDTVLFFPKKTAPDNLHEFDIILLDLTANSAISYNNEQHYCLNNNHHISHGVSCGYPRDNINLKPYEISILKEQIEEIRSKKQIIVIAFCGEAITESYDFIQMASDGWSRKNSFSINTQSFYHEAPRFHQKSGLKVKSSESNFLHNLTSKYKFSYKNIFDHPVEYDQTAKENVLSKNFCPLLLNESNEVVAYTHNIGKMVAFVFPDVENKASFVEDLLTNHLPDMFPNSFPSHGLFGWLNNGDYLLPNEKELYDKKKKLKSEYERSINEIDEQIQATHDTHIFLHNLLTETGDNLVSAVKFYLEWLGFENVVDMDEKAGEVYEEDLQIENAKGLLVIEVKGIGGTSTDKACSQISKIKFRRAQQRNAFDVSALYIVNHQRYLAPKDRQNPPFTQNQVNDATLDRRGLLSTYDLYKAYFQIENGIITKEDARDSLYKFGLIKIEPSSKILIGKPDKKDYYNSNKVVIFNLSPEIKLEVGDELLALKNNIYTRVKIVSIQVNSEDVNNASGCEAGVLLSQPVEKNSVFYLSTCKNVCNE